MCYLWHLTVSEGCLNIIPCAERTTNEENQSKAEGVAKLHLMRAHDIEQLKIQTMKM